MRLVLVDPPAVEPLTAADVRAFLPSVEATDLQIESWVRSARCKLDGWTGALGRALVTQTWDMVLDGVPRVGCRAPMRDALWLPLPPLQSVTSIVYRDVDGASQTIPAGAYRVGPGDPGFVIMAPGEAWPALQTGPAAMTVRFVAGYGDASDDVPEPIRQALVLDISLSAASAARDPLLAREVITGVGEFAYAGGVQSAAMLGGQINALLSPFRVSGGIS